MSWNSGAGSPHYFRCSQCRRDRPRVHDRRAEGWNGFIVAARLTGRTRWRNAALTREYKCTDCGHVGWSSHNDLARALPLTLAFHAGKRPMVKNPNFAAPYGKNDPGRRERTAAMNSGFAELYGGHRYPIPVESTMGTDGVRAATDGILVHRCGDCDPMPSNAMPTDALLPIKEPINFAPAYARVSPFARKQPANKRARGKRK